MRGVADTILWAWLVSCVVCALVCAGIASSKNRSTIGFFFAGLILGVIGLVLCLTAPQDAPKGMRVFKCPRCNAQTNIPANSETVECWQCHLTSDADKAGR
jgi:hypothetical protein